MSGTEIRAAVYARVSTEEQAEKGYSIEAQIEDCLARARSLGFKEEEIAVFMDDMSGGLLERPGLNKLRELAASRNPPEAVIIYDPDRFARKLSHQLLVTDELIRRGIRLEFVNFEWKNTPEGRMFYQLRGMFAEFEREKIRERTMRGRLMKVKRHGKLSGDPRLYGYRFDPEQDLLVVDEEESQVVRLIFQWCAEGKSGEQIARQLAKSGIPAPRGSVWYGSTVTRILRNQTYLGTFMAYKTDYHHGFRRVRPAEEQFPIPVEPLVDAETFEKAQSTLEKHRTKTGRPAERIYLLSGLGLCSCGRSILASTVSGARKRAYYYCSSKKQRGYGTEGKPMCDAPYWNAEIVDNIVWKHLRQMVENANPLLERWSKTKSGPESSDGNMLQLSVLTGRKFSLKKQLDRLLDLFLAGGVSASVYEEKRSELEGRLDAADSAIRELADRMGRGEGAAPAESLETELRQALDEAGAELRKQLADLLIENVVFGPGRELAIRFATACLSGKPYDGESDGGP
jgi:site-specific DNA recombinase